MSLLEATIDIELDMSRPTPPEGTAEAVLESWGEARVFSGKNPTAEADSYNIERPMFRIEGTEYNTLTGFETLLLPYDLWITLDENTQISQGKDPKGSPINWRLGAFFRAFGKSMKGHKLSDLTGGRCVVTIKPEIGKEGEPTGYAKVTAVKKLPD